MTKKDVWPFFGMAGYYQKCIPGFNHVATRVSNLTWKATPEKVVWMDECESVFKTLKDELTLPPVLHLPNVTVPFIVRTDVSWEGIAAVLLQECLDSKINPAPIVFSSHKLSDAEMRYNMSEMECLTVVWTIEKFEPYLYGCKFILQKITNCSLTYPKLSIQMHVLCTASLLMQQFTFCDEYIAGKKRPFGC